MEEKIKKLQNYFGESVHHDKANKEKGYITNLKKFTSDDAVRLAYLQLEFEIKRSGSSMTLHFQLNNQIKTK